MRGAPQDVTVPAAPSRSPSTVIGMVELDEVGNDLVRAAARLLADEGPASLTVRRIAAEAGATTMNVYTRFGGKDGVVEHLFLDGFDRLWREVDAVPTTDDPVADLAGCAEAYRRFARGNPTYYSVMFLRVVPDFEPSGAALERATAVLGQLADRIERVVAAGSMPPGDTFGTAAGVWATCHGMVSLELGAASSPNVDWDAVYGRITRALVEGLAREPVGHPDGRAGGDSR